MADSHPTPDVHPYDALLLVSFGGPEQPADVVPFLENVTRGRNIPRERLEEVGRHYFAFGGRSPINDQCRALVAAVESDLRTHGIDLPVYWGNRNWDPFLTDTLATMAADGIGRAACLLTSAYASYSGCRQYRENLFDAAQAVARPPRLDRLRHYYNHPGFVAPFVDAVLEARKQVPEDARLVFVTHSIPEAMDAGSGPDGHAYSRQHRLVAGEVADRVAERAGGPVLWDLVYCSRSGPPHVPWLEPDVNDHLEMLAEVGEPGAVAVPIGFVSDHMEVVYDLDTEAADTAGRLGLPYARAATPGVDPRFVAMVRDLLLERAAAERGDTAGPYGRRTVPATVAGSAPSWHVCPPGCCPNPRGGRPALCGDEEQTRA
ncbi:MAG TPA: ferrochelatase [Nocardioidaceae bacterium]|nr:ferrochelatase [Nocardioidaceae bacterium]